ncbi:MAG: GNAT family N-acetyltransferase [Bacteroidota bacterium]|nr:GNAT family N-acetyltransferase [Bacteroidota bacterium]
MSSVTLRNANEADIDLIRDLTFKVWPQTYEQLLTPEQINYMLEIMYSKESLKKQMAEDHQFIILYDNDIPIGFASYSEIEPQLFKLHKLYILPAHHGSGKGRFVIDHIQNDILTKGAKALQLNVNRNNIAKIFYERLGFEVIRTEDIDIGNGYFMNDYIMEKKLKNESSTNKALKT